MISQHAYANPFGPHKYGFDTTYPFRRTPAQFVGHTDDNSIIVNQLRQDGIYVTHECKPDTRSGTFENRFCHQDSDCCYSIDFIKSHSNPCKLVCREVTGGAHHFFGHTTHKCQRVPYCFN